MGKLTRSQTSLKTGTIVWTQWGERMTTLPNKRYNGHCNSTEEEEDQRTSWKVNMLKEMSCGQQVSNGSGRRRRRQHKTEMDGQKWSGAYVPLGATSWVKFKLHLYLDLLWICSTCCATSQQQAVQSVCKNQKPTRNPQRVAMSYSLSYDLLSSNKSKWWS